MIDVSCILINYNTSKFTIDCIISILKNSKDSLSYEIVVVDNASHKADLKALNDGISKIHSEKVTLVKSTLNTGFGGGNMLGVKNASPCRYYAFINNDTLFETTNTLRKLFNFMESHPEVGVCSPQMLDEHKKFRKTIDHFASPQREILKRGFLEWVNPKRFPKRKKHYEHPLKVDYIQGAFMFINAQDFNDVGGFDTNLFLYYEESDICRRILKQKKKVTYLVPNVEYIHFESASTSSNLKMKIEQKISLFYYLRKHFGWYQFKIVQVYFCIRYFFSSFFNTNYWPLFRLLIKGMPMSQSIKYQQKPLHD